MASPQDVSYQLRFGVSKSAFMRESESSERFGYNVYSPQFSFVRPDNLPVALFASVGGEFAHSDGTSLNSQRHMLVGEVGFHGFLPSAFFRRFNFEAGLKAGAGFSKINFGGGDNPEPGFDGQIGLLARLMINLDVVSLGGGAVYGFSPFRKYTELGFGVFLAVPLQYTITPSTPPTDECPKLSASK